MIQHATLPFRRVQALFQAAFGLPIHENGQAVTVSRPDRREPPRMSLSQSMAAERLNKRRTGPVTLPRYVRLDACDH